MRRCSGIVIAFIIAIAMANAQNTNDTNRVHFIEPDAGFSIETSDDCSHADVFITPDTLWGGDVYMMRNYTDQLLTICGSNSVLPASGIWGYNRNGKYYRSAHPFGDVHVFAERIVTGKLSLYYCRALPNDYEEYRVITKDPDHIGYHNTMIDEYRRSGRYKNNFYYFISPAYDTTQLVMVTNSNIDTVAEKYLSDNPAAYKDAMSYKMDRTNRIMQRILLPVGALLFVVGFVNLESMGLVVLGVANPLFYVAIAAFGTYAYLRIKKKDKSIHPNEMIRIVSSYNAGNSGE